MSTILSNDELDAIERRLEACSPGPWRHRMHGFIESGADDAQVIGVTCQGPDGGSVSLPAADNAEFIAHARQDVPALLAEVRSLRDRIEELEAALHSANAPARQRVR